MKVSDVVARFLAEHVRHVFCISGGASLHLIHSIAKQEGLTYVCPQNEQAASFQADAYARLSGMGCALTTSGPGATNLITGIATSYYDSVPVLYITGQQTRDRLSGDSGCRQIGFQETPITEIVRPITKYAVTVMKKEHIVRELEHAVYAAKSGRPGPVLVDIPDDLQREDVPPMHLMHYMPPWHKLETHGAAIVMHELLVAKRPLFIFGSAVGNVADAKKIMFSLGIPCVTTWGAADHFGDDPLWFGGFGTHGVRYANFAVQNADYVVTVGTRLDTKATGSPASAFAPKAKLVMVDIDQAELGKMKRIGRPLHRAIHADASQFLQALGCEVSNYVAYDEPLGTTDYDQIFSRPWVERLARWREEYPAVLPAYRSEVANPYAFIEKLSDLIRPDDVIVSDTGCALGWMMQAFKFSGQRFLHAWNNTPMGYGLPAAIGASFSGSGAAPRRVVLITGDGGLAVNITELATVARHRLPVKVILFNNRGHAMCRATQRTWFDGSYPSTSHDGGLATPDYSAVARAYGIPTYSDERSLGPMINELSGPGFFEFSVPDTYQISPQVRAGKLLHDADPALPPEEIAEIMA